MPSRVKLLAHALAEIQEQYEALEVRFERLTRENAALRAKAKRLEARVEELQSRPSDPPEDRP